MNQTLPKPPAMLKPPQVDPPAKKIADAAPVTFSTGLKSKAGERILLYSVEGWGKTTMATFTPNPTILQVDGETGYNKLLANKLVADLPHNSDLLDDWTVLLATLDNPGLKAGDTLVIDTINGAERLCRSFVCRTEFKGDWGERGYARFGAGQKVTASTWEGLIQRLDALHRRGIHVVLLAHAIVARFTEPGSEGYDRYVPDLAHSDKSSTWSPVFRWADAVMFGNFVTYVTSERGRNVAVGGKDRVVYYERDAAFDAKNRYNKPATINLSDPAQTGEPTEPIKLAAHRLWEGIFNNA